MSEQSDISDGIVYARAHTGIAPGICVHVDDQHLVQWAGPIKNSKTPEKNHVMLMNPDDFAKLKDAVEKRRN